MDFRSSCFALLNVKVLILCWSSSCSCSSSSIAAAAPVIRTIRAALWSSSRADASVNQSTPAGSRRPARRPLCHQYWSTESRAKPSLLLAASLLTSAAGGAAGGGFHCSLPAASQTARAKIPISRLPIRTYHGVFLLNGAFFYSSDLLRPC